MASNERRRSTLQKIIETGFCSLTWTALGLYLEIYGPTLIDLKIKLNANYEEVTSGVMGRAVGLFPGSVLGGLLVDKFPGFCHLFIAVSLLIAAGVTVPVPLLPGVQYLWPLCFIGGLVESIINVAGQRIILRLWGEKAAAPMLFLHAGYGIGSLLVPLYSNPFLAVPMKPSGNVTNASVSVTDITTGAPREGSHSAVKYIEESRIEYSYLISSIPLVFMAVVFCVYQIREICYMIRSRNYYVDSKAVNNFYSAEKKTSTDNSGSRTFREMIDPATCAAGKRCYAIELWVILIIYFSNAGGGERLMGSYVRSYSVDQLDFDKSDASLVNMTFWISFLAGRLSFFLVAKWVSIRKVLLIHTGSVLVVSVLMNIFARNSSVAYWVLVQCLAFFHAPSWPAGVSWVDYHIELTGLGMMVVLLGGSIGGTYHLKLIGYFYEHKGPLSFLYQIAGYGALAFAMAVVLTLVGSQHGNRFKWKERECGVSRTETEIMLEENKDTDTRDIKHPLDKTN